MAKSKRERNRVSGASALSHFLRIIPDATKQKRLPQAHVLRACAVGDASGSCSAHENVEDEVR